MLLVSMASSVLAHGGYHHNGAVTSTRYDGAQAWIEVTNPTARAGTQDFVVSRIMMKKDPSGPGPEQAWLEVGWAETGCCGLVGGVPEQYVYTFDTAGGGWEFYGALCVTSGCHIDVRIVKDSSCDIGDPTCIWKAQQFNHSTGTWQNLRSVSLPMDRGYIEEYTEIYQDPDFPMSGHIDVDQTYNGLDWFETQRRYSDDTWHLWNSSNTGTGSVSPYCIDWIANYYEFEAQEGGC